MGTYVNQSQLPTYRAATTASVVAAASAKTFFLIEGSATKGVLVTRIILSGPTTADIEYNSYVVEKFSTASAGGTIVTLTKTPLNSQYAAATANKVQVYTAEPTTEGTLVGTIACRRVLLQDTTAAAGGIPDVLCIDFTDLDGGGVVLHGVAQGLGVAFGAAPAAAVTLGVEVEWKEI